MEYDLRSIAYIAELIHAPRQHQAADLQRLHQVAFHDPRCPYQNFQLIPGGATLFNAPNQGGMISSVHVLPDRLQIREEMTGISREDFQERLERLASYSLQYLGVEQYAAQNFVVRSLVNPRNYYDSREFMARSVLNMEEDDFSCLDRKPQIVGLRMVFPETPESRGFFNVRVESYAAEPRSVFIENVAIYRSLISGGNVSELTSNFFATYDYVDANIVDFIAQFDSKETPPPEA
jgi:hypothetical protein